MTFRYSNRVKVTAAAPGTAAFPATAAATGFIGFNSIPSIVNGDIVPYTAWDGGANWETGWATYNTTGPVLTRTTIVQNSLGNTSAINFSSGIVTIYCDATAASLPLLDQNGFLGVGTSVSGGVTGVARAEFSSGTGTLSLSAYNTGASGAAFYHRIVNVAASFSVFNYAGTDVGSFTTTGADLALNSTGALNLYVSSGTNGIKIAANGAIRFPLYGVGTLVSDASGNITTSSDPAAKYFVGQFQPGLSEILAIARNDKFMGRHRWKESSGMETEGVYASFFAHEDFPIADAVHKKDGQFNSLFERPIIMGLVNAAADLQAEIDELKAQVKALLAKG